MHPVRDDAIALIEGFRLVHEPLRGGDPAMPSLGHAALRTALTERLEHSDGGAFLLGGFRGAGKTTLTRQVVDALDGSPANGRTWVAIRLDVAHPLSTTDLLYTVMRRLHEALDDRGLLARLQPKVRKAIDMSYLRTSASVATRRSQSSERSTTMGLTGLPSALTGPLAGLGPSLGRSTTHTDSVGTDVAFLTYADNDVEHDLLRIIDLLSRTPLRATTWWGRRRSRTDPPVHVVVVLDELDKLTGDPAGEECLDDILAALKNVLASSGVHFILVAGADLLDRALLDSEHGNGLFESVFAWTAYVPCLWQAPELLVQRLVRPTAGQDPAALCEYLQFKARGIPRRLLLELNNLVRWHGGDAALVLSEPDRLRVAFYARLNTVLDGFVDSRIDDRTDERQGVEYDRFRLGAHYVIDWTLRTEGAVFVATDLLDGPRALNQVLAVSQQTADELLDHLAGTGVLDRMNEPGSPYSTQIGDVRSTTLIRYRLSSSVRDELRAMTQGSRRERADLLGDAAPFMSRVDPYGSGPLQNIVRPPDAPPPQPFAPPDPTAPTAPTAPPAPAGAGGPSPAADRPGGVADATTVTYPNASGGSGGIAPAVPPDPPDVPLSAELGAANWSVPRSEQLVGGGRYRLLDVIGVGGMGTVYRATDTLHDRPVAIKMLSSWAIRDTALRKRFLRESRIATNIDLPGVVRTFDLLDEPDGRLGIVMELAAGTPLDAFLADGRLNVGVAVSLTVELLAIVGQLHALDLMRLDIKPGNILLDRNQHPLLLDLGLAKPTIDEARMDRTDVSTFVGTPAFSAPEQLRGEPFDRRVDVYSCGCLLFQLLGGDLVSGESVFQLMRRRLEQQHLPVEQLTCSPALREVVATATARDPGDRYPSADAFRLELRNVPESPQHAPPPPDH